MPALEREMQSYTTLDVQTILFDGRVAPVLPDGEVIQLAYDDRAGQLVQLVKAKTSSPSEKPLSIHDKSAYDKFLIRIGLNSRAPQLEVAPIDRETRQIAYRGGILVTLANQEVKTFDEDKAITYAANPYYIAGISCYGEICCVREGNGANPRIPDDHLKIVVKTLDRELKESALWTEVDALVSEGPKFCHGGTVAGLNGIFCVSDEITLTFKFISPTGECLSEWIMPKPPLTTPHSENSPKLRQGQAMCRAVCVDRYGTGVFAIWMPGPLVDDIGPHTLVAWWKPGQGVRLYKLEIYPRSVVVGPHGYLYCAIDNFGTLPSRVWVVKHPVWEDGLDTNEWFAHSES